MSFAAIEHDAQAPQPFLFALKDGDTFVVCDSHGDIAGKGDGLFRDDTRMLSGLLLRIAGFKPNLLSAARSRDNVFLNAHLVNNPLTPLGGPAMPGGVIHLKRTKLLWRGCLYERIQCTNYSDCEGLLPLSFRLAADFADMFEVRGSKRKSRGRLEEPQVGRARVTFRYEGLDGILRSTSIAFSEPPSRLEANEAQFPLTLPPGGRKDIYLEIASRIEDIPNRERFRHAAARARWDMRKRLRRPARPVTPGRLFNAWLERSRADLALLTTELPSGPFPYAGIPWFSTPFGRDAVVTALQTLWLDPALAHGVLSYLAQTQAKDTSSFKDSAPGKIMHETRKGEMTAIGELPFGQYYGGIDTTPLFVMLAGAYADRTGDLALIDTLWPALTAALRWIENVIDGDNHSLLVYRRGEKSGLANQGWKDSEDSIFHADGRMAKGPIALVEVQAYAFAALLVMAHLAEKRADIESAVDWRARAEALRRRVEDGFWMADRGFYGIAIDGDGALCRVVASNPGHLLYVGLPTPERAHRVVEMLLSARMDSGWGVRTLASGEAHFNPMSYHNGSVWPHDTALCAAGMARYGARGGAVRLLSEMFEAAATFDMQLPELFCGFDRSAGEPPIAYPVACMPQAWAAGAPFMMLQACLGICIDGFKREIHVDQPHLPIGIDEVVLRDIAMGEFKFNLGFERMGKHVVVTPSGSQSDHVAIIVHA